MGQLRFVSRSPCFFNQLGGLGHQVTTVAHLIQGVLQALHDLDPTSQIIHRACQLAHRLEVADLEIEPAKVGVAVGPPGKDFVLDDGVEGILSRFAKFQGARVELCGRRIIVSGPCLVALGPELQQLLSRLCGAAPLGLLCFLGLGLCLVDCHMCPQ